MIVLPITLPKIDAALVAKAIALFQDERFTNMTQQIAFEQGMVEKADIGDWLALFIDELGVRGTSEEPKLKKLQFMKENQSMAEDIVVGSRNEFKITVLKAKKDEEGNLKFLYATYKKSFEISRFRSVWAWLFGIGKEEADQLMKQLSSSENAIKAFLAYKLAEAITNYSGADDGVKVQLICNDN